MPFTQEFGMKNGRAYRAEQLKLVRREVKKENSADPGSRRLSPLSLSEAQICLRVNVTSETQGRIE
jgi:hypothetical protein